MWPCLQKIQFLCKKLLVYKNSCCVGSKLILRIPPKTKSRATTIMFPSVGTQTSTSSHYLWFPREKTQISNSLQTAKSRVPDSSLKVLQGWNKLLVRLPWQVPHATGWEEFLSNIAENWYFHHTFGNTGQVTVIRIFQPCSPLFISTRMRILYPKINPNPISELMLRNIWWDSLPIFSSSFIKTYIVIHQEWDLVNTSLWRSQHMF